MGLEKAILLISIVNFPPSSAPSQKCHSEPRELEVGERICVRVLASLRDGISEALPQVRSRLTHLEFASSSWISMLCWTFACKAAIRENCFNLISILITTAILKELANLHVSLNDLDSPISVFQPILSQPLLHIEGKARFCTLVSCTFQLLETYYISITRFRPPQPPSWRQYPRWSTSRLWRDWRLSFSIRRRMMLPSWYFWCSPAYSTNSFSKINQIPTTTFGSRSLKLQMQTRKERTQETLDRSWRRV